MRSNAINPNFSVWVNASAGTGKTKILIDRVLRLLLERKRNILCLTFTNAAANEIENRIYNTLSKWAICPDSVLITDLQKLNFFSQHPYLSSKCLTIKFKKNKDYLRRLFSKLENLNLTIETIHAFCYKLISRFPTEVGIAPNCTLSECKELHSIIFNNMVNNDKTVQDNINIIATEIDENKLRDLLYTLCVKRLVLKNDLEYIKDKLNVSDKIQNLQSETTEQIKKLAEILSKGSKRDKNYSTMLYNWNNNEENLAKVFLKSESHKKKNISSIITKNSLKEFESAEQMIKNIQNAVSTYVRDINSHQIFKRTSSLLSILKVYIKLYNNEKSKNALLDYNDIINLATNLLNNQSYKDFVLLHLDQKIDHILVDEAQDNSSNQWEIITNLYDKFFIGDNEKKTLFIVGDLKQSIYRFQGANPHLFNYMQQYFYTKTNGKNWTSYQLEESFRSAPEILTFIDRIFNNFRKEISFNDKKIKHIPNRKNDQGYIEIWPLLPRYKKENQQALQLVHRKNYIIRDRLLAQAIAHKIHNWLNEGRILVAKDRHIEPKDIIILVRQRNMLVDYIISELKKVNVPVIGRDYFKIMDYIAVQDLIALAEFLLLQENDLALANVLKSPLFNFTEDDLFNIAYDRKGQSLWKKLQDYQKIISNELNYLINLSKIESPLILFTHILRTGKKKFAKRLGIKCFEVLDEFMNLVLEFENPSLQAFVQWIKENNPEIKNDMQSERNVVRIMTIHKSKGLQAPIVFLADTDTVPKNRESIVFDAKEAPFWCQKNNNIYCDQVKKEKKLENYNEYLRLLYVALTRAEDELYILGKEPVQKGSWYELVTKYGEPYEKKQGDLYPISKEKVEILCINANYPSIYRKLDYFDTPVISPPSNLSTLFQKNKKEEIMQYSSLDTVLFQHTTKKKPISATCSPVSLFQHLIPNFSEKKLSSNYLDDKKDTKMIWYNDAKITNCYSRGLIIHSILQYLPKIKKDRRKNWIRKYLESINTKENKNEIYSKILAFNKRYDYLFNLEGKSEVTLSGIINRKPILIRLDRLCITQDKIIIIDYKSHRNISISLLNEIKEQMLIYKTLVQEVYPNKQIQCVIIWIEDLIVDNTLLQ